MYLTYGLIAILTIVPLFLSGCSSNGQDSTTQTAPTIVTPAPNEEPEKDLPIPISSSKFQNKHLVFFGDSITEFGNYPSDTGKLLEAHVTNLGIGGTTVARHSDRAYDGLSGYKIADALYTNDFTSLEIAVNTVISNTQTEKYSGDNNRTQIQTLKTLNWDNVDYIVLSYGTNDFNVGTLIGTEFDTILDKYNFSASYTYLIHTLKLKAPKAEIIAVSPIWRKKTPMDREGIEGGSDVSTNTSGLYLISYVDTLQKVSAINNIKFLDLYRTSGISEDTDHIYLADPVHPNSAGYNLMANKLVDFMKENY